MIASSGFSVGLMHRDRCSGGTLAGATVIFDLAAPSGKRAIAAPARGVEGD